MKLYKASIAIFALAILISCGNCNNGNSYRDVVAHDSLSQKSDTIEVDNEENANIRLIKNQYPNSQVVCLHQKGGYYRAYPVGDDALAHLIRVNDDQIVADKEFPHEYGDIAKFLIGKGKILVGINWSGQCKIVTLTEGLTPLCSKIYSYPEGEWTQLDTLCLVSDDTYYAEIRTNCGDCGEGINRYKITADFHHVILTSSVEAIGEFRGGNN